MSRKSLAVLVLIGGLVFCGHASPTVAQEKQPVPSQGIPSTSGIAKAFPLPAGSALTMNNWIRVAHMADFVVVGTVEEINSYYGTNEHGFHLILSDLTLNVSSVLKGEHVQRLTFTVEGGTVGDITLHVSSVPELKRASTYVFLLKPDPQGALQLFGTNFGALPVAKEARVEALNADLVTLHNTLGR